MKQSAVREVLFQSRGKTPEARGLYGWILAGRGENRMALIILISLISTGLLAADVILKVRTLATG
jgi:hypothetical protein